jgi:hypothetical protein
MYCPFRTSNNINEFAFTSATASSVSPITSGVAANENSPGPPPSDPNDRVTEPAGSKATILPRSISVMKKEPLEATAINDV